jgi:hypothetical protein
VSWVDPVTHMADSSHRLGRRPHSLLALSGSLAQQALYIFMFSVDSSCSSEQRLANPGVA